MSETDCDTSSWRAACPRLKRSAEAMRPESEETPDEPLAIAGTGGRETETHSTKSSSSFHEIDRPVANWRRTESGCLDIQLPSSIKRVSRGKSLRPSQYGPDDRVGHGGSHGPIKKGGCVMWPNFFEEKKSSEIQANRLNSGEIRLNSGKFSGEIVLKSGKTNFAWIQAKKILPEIAWIFFIFSCISLKKNSHFLCISPDFRQKLLNSGHFSWNLLNSGDFLLK